MCTNNNSIRLVIPIPEIKNNSIFIAIPYTDDFKPLSEILLNAIAQVKMVPHRTDLNPRSQVLIDDIKQGIQCAKIVIAVCSPENKSNKPNANVMYELGLANALGKATLILTTDISTLPFDIAQIKTITYYHTNGTIQDKENLILKLTNELLQLKSKIKNGYTDNDTYPGHTILKPINFWMLDSTSNKCCVCVLTFAEKIIEKFQGVICSYLMPIVSNLSVIVRITQKKIKNDNTTMVDVYASLIHIVNNNELNETRMTRDFNRAIKDLEDALKSCDKLTSKTVEFTNLIIILNKLFKDIQAALNRYLEIRHQIDDYIKLLNETHPQRSDIISSQELLIRNMSAQVEIQSVISNLNNLILNAIQVWDQ